ncbi:M48 family metallopeptidase [Streptomyces sp. NPDC047515]|uniref:M48 family metallopeptidase n=1 Tax=Streptomyces sp. NPDC047515 TaxID=3155380 RepID=UPI0033CFD974
MTPTLRAVRAVALLAGFHLLGVLLLAVLCVANWAVFRWAWLPVAVMFLARTSVPALSIVRSMSLPRTPEHDDVRGLRVDDSRQPRLWAMVRDLADRAGTRAPDDLVLTAEVGASAVEHTRLLGLVAGRRRLLVGVPLLAGMSEAQLRFVLAYEMSRYADSDTRLAAVVTRGRDQTARAVAHFREQAEKAVARERERQEQKAATARAKGRKPRKIDPGHAGASYRLLAARYQRYQRFCTRVTTSDIDRAKAAADVAAARIAGRDVSACALREFRVLRRTHEEYMDSYALLGVKAGLLPPPGQVLGGLRHVLAARRDVLDESRDSLPPGASASRTHGLFTERIARIEALPDDGRAPAPVAPALDLLVDTERTLAAVEEQVLAPELLRLRRVDWPDLLHESVAVHEEPTARYMVRAVASATGGDGSAAEALDAVDAGAQWQIADCLHKSAKARQATGRVAREFARHAFRSGLRKLAEAEYVRQGRARWRLPWTDDEASLELPPGHSELLPAALDASVADVPDTKPLRALLDPDLRPLPRTGLPRTGLPRIEPGPSTTTPRLLPSATALRESLRAREHLWAKVQKKVRRTPPWTAPGSTPDPHDKKIPDKKLPAEEIRDEEIRTALRCGDWRAGAAFLRKAGRNRQERYRRAAVLQDEAAADDAWLLAWRAARPTDAGAALVHAGALIEVAAQVHGTKPTQHPTWEQSSVFRQVMARAREACHQAQALAGDDPCPYVAEIPCALALGYDRAECRALWAKIVVRGGPHLAAHDTALRYWCHRWAGSYRQAGYLAQEAARRSSPGRLLSLLPLYAAFKEERSSSETDPDEYYKSPELIAAADACLADVAAAAAADPEGRRLVRARHMLAWTLYWQDRYEEAMEQFRLIDCPVADNLPSPYAPWSYYTSPKRFFTTCHEYSALKVAEDD